MPKFLTILPPLCVGLLEENPKVLNLHILLLYVIGGFPENVCGISSINLTLAPSSGNFNLTLFIPPKLMFISSNNILKNSNKSFSFFCILLIFPF